MLNPREQLLLFRGIKIVFTPEFATEDNNIYVRDWRPSDSTWTNETYTDSDYE